jgi:hypothetical protein
MIVYMAANEFISNMNVVCEKVLLMYRAFIIIHHYSSAITATNFINILKNIIIYHHIFQSVIT